MLIHSRFRPVERKRLNEQLMEPSSDRIIVARAAARPTSAAAPDGCHGRHRTGANAGSYVRIVV
jgi:hypothetical protein